MDMAVEKVGGRRTAALIGVALLAGVGIAIWAARRAEPPRWRKTLRRSGEAGRMLATRVASVRSRMEDAREPPRWLFRLPETLVEALVDGR